MADTKITGLTNFDSSNTPYWPPAPASDVIPIVDISDATMAASGTTKKISINNLLSSSPTATGALTVTGLVTAGSASITGALTLTGGTANGVPYLNASKVVTTGTNLSFANTPGFFDSTLNINSLLGSALYRGGITVSEDNLGFTLFGGSGYKLIQTSGYSTPNELIFYVSNAEAARLNSTSNLVLKGGTAAANGVGVTFPATQVASSDANCLDDYEEGTWTIVVNDQLGNSATIASQIARYVKIGRRVSVFGDFTLSAKGSAGGGSLVYLGTLPFVPVATCFEGGVVHRYDNTTLTTNGQINIMSAAGGNTVCLFPVSSATTGTSFLTFTQITNTTRFVFNFSYDV